MSRADNQYEGSLFEYLICQIHNKEKYVNIYQDKVSQERYLSIVQDAISFCSANLLPCEKAQWIGRKTSNENGDILIGSKYIEIKYVSEGTGTYLNTSLEKLTEYGFSSYRTYMEKYGLYSELEKYLPINKSTASPVDMETAKNFKKVFPKQYKYLQDIEKPIRKQYVKDLFAYLCSNPTTLTRLLGDILSKTISGKEKPDTLFVYNYVKKSITCYDANSIIEKINSKSFKNAGLSLVFDSVRLAIGWQNCGPLNNPTIRCFIR